MAFSGANLRNASIGLLNNLGSGVRNLMRYGKAFGERDPELIEDDVVRILIGIPDAGEESPTQQVPPQVIRLLNVLKEELKDKGVRSSFLTGFCGE